jgi:hypothetical protein
MENLDHKFKWRVMLKLKTISTLTTVRNLSKSVVRTIPFFCSKNMVGIRGKVSVTFGKYRKSIQCLLWIIFYRTLFSYTQRVLNDL